MVYPPNAKWATPLHVAFPSFYRPRREAPYNLGPLPTRASLSPLCASAAPRHFACFPRVSACGRKSSRQRVFGWHCVNPCSMEILYKDILRQCSTSSFPCGNHKVHVSPPVRIGRLARYLEFPLRSLATCTYARHPNTFRCR